MSLQPEIIQKLTAIVGENYIFTDIETRNHYGHDETEDYVFPPNVVVKPANAQEIAAVLKANPSVRISITGHTDSDGADAANLTLSQKRAATVKDILVNEFAIDAARMETDGKGETKPVTDNKTKEGKAANRRVEFTKL